jgi:hypothetical protein
MCLTASLACADSSLYTLKKAADASNKFHPAQSVLISIAQNYVADGEHMWFHRNADPIYSSSHRSELQFSTAEF